jgi:hypothetical protein
MPARRFTLGLFARIILRGGQTTHKLPEALTTLDPETHNTIFEIFEIEH